MRLGHDHARVRVPATSANLGPGFDALGLALALHDDLDVRALGSAAAAAVGGVLLARALLAEPEALDDDVVLAIACGLEGHPDNAAPAILGGATIAWVEADDAAPTAARPRAIRLAVHADIEPVVIVPAFRLATKTARGVLPATVPHADAAAQAGRAALLVEALGRRPDRRGLGDRGSVRRADGRLAGPPARCRRGRRARVAGRLT